MAASSNKANSEGFLILTASDADMVRGFDSWIENEEMLRRHFEEAQWIVDWS